MKIIHQAKFVTMDLQVHATLASNKDAPCQTGGVAPACLVPAIPLWPTRGPTRSTFAFRELLISLNMTACEDLKISNLLTIKDTRQSSARCRLRWGKTVPLPQRACQQNFAHAPKLNLCPSKCQQRLRTAARFRLRSRDCRAARRRCFILTNLDGNSAFAATC